MTDFDLYSKCIIFLVETLLHYKLECLIKYNQLCPKTYHGADMWPTWKLNASQSTRAIHLRLSFKSAIIPCDLVMQPGITVKMQREKVERGPNMTAKTHH